MQLFSSTFTILERSLGYSTLKDQTINNNIANISTPNYKAKDVVRISFSDELNQSLKALKTDARHIDFSTQVEGPAVVKERSDTFTNNNGNNVDIELEMLESAENQIYYYSMIDRLNGKFNSLSNVIKGGK